MPTARTIFGSLLSVVASLGLAAEAQARPRIGIGISVGSPPLSIYYGSSRYRYLYDYPYAYPYRSVGVVVSGVPYYGVYAEPYSVVPPYLPQTVPPAASHARIRVILPAVDTEVAFEGVSVGVAGRDRTFDTPELEPGKWYTYVITATWTLEGKKMTEQRKVDVRAGQVSVVDFTRPAPLPVAPVPK